MKGSAFVSLLALALFLLLKVSAKPSDPFDLPANENVGQLEQGSTSSDLLYQPGSCGAQKPCPAGLCCSKWGFCGTGPNYCGNDGIQGGDKKSTTTLTKNSMRGIQSFFLNAVYQQGSCGPQKPCPAGLCCSKWGFCGTGPNYCGNDGIQGIQSFFLNAVYQPGSCGAQKPCPAGLCCSKWGFCGTGPNYCGNDGIQGIQSFFLNAV